MTARAPQERDGTELVEAMPPSRVNPEELRRLIEIPTEEEYRFIQRLTPGERLERAMELTRFIRRWRDGFHGPG